MIVIDSKYKFLVDGVIGTAAADTTTDFDYAMTSSWALYGLGLLQNGATFGDYVSVKIIDKDNVLGYGANFVVATPVVKAYVDPSSSRIQAESEYARTIPTGLYIRISYTSIALLTTTQVAVNLYFINPT